MTTDTVDIPKLASTYSLLGEASRARILFSLESERLTARELCDRVGIAQSNLSHHLSKMHYGQLINYRRDGKHVYYHLTKLGKVVLTGLKNVAKCQQ